MALPANQFFKTLRELVDPALVFGFACALAWLMITIRAGVLISATADPLVVHVPFYLWLTATAAVALVAGGLAGERLNGPLSNPVARAAPTLAMVAGTAALPLVASTDSRTAVVLAACAGALAGGGLGIFFLQWGFVWTTYGFKVVVASAIASWGFCAAFFVAVLLFDPVAATLASVALPCVSLLLLQIAGRHPDKAPPFGRGTGRASGSRKMVGRLAALGLVYGFVNEWTRLSLIQRSSDTGPGYFAAANALALVIALVVVSITILTPLAANPDVRVELLYRFVLLLSVVATMLLVLDEDPPFISYALNMAAYLCLAVTLWAATISLSRRFPKGNGRIIGIVVAAWMAGPLIGAQLNHELHVAGAVPTPQVSAVAGVCAILAVYGFVYRESDIASTTMEGRAGDLTEKCAQVAWRHNLTERESQILACLARGRDAPWVQKRLWLAHSTVSTHRQHIYEKLGVHSQQELIDLVEGA
ncbi:MAG: helix-turn-helix transcriptional regulator [Bifidobacteriaceae bacterium]|jgi:DNA-binding CsgD family transcriptional regulator|nr:helix-turn-helix transcriptional regulator [Bifidobacteriaceae bacterium]